MKKFIILLLILLPGLSSLAQTVYKNQVRIDNTSISRSDDNRLTIAMDVVLLPNMKVTSNRAAILTPILSIEGQNRELQPIVVYGRRRQIVDARNNTVPKNAYKTVRRKSGTEQTVKYIAQIPYETWMQNAKLSMNCDLCGCRDLVEANSLEPITTLNIQREQPKPEVAFVTPKAEPVKVRSVVGRAFLDYPVNKTTIYPNYRKNQSELAKIRATIDTVRNDKNVSITGITIDGYASPEGPYANNARLAKGRTQALLNYVRNYYNYPKDIMHMTSTPEDWVGYRKYVENSNLAKKSDILKMMDASETDMDAKEHRIAKLVEPSVYHSILTNCFVALRHADYAVTYTVRGFNNDETREIIKKHPQQLSLQEIYNLAMTYEPGSEDFNHAFEVAVLMFPDDPTANMNAAAVEIQRGNLDKAKQYLAKANQKNGATLNNLGVVELLEGNYDKAQNYLTSAKQAGIFEADNNLLQVDKQRSYPQIDVASKK